MSRALALALVATLFGLTGCENREAGVMVGTLERDRIELVADVSEPVLEVAIADGSVVDAGTLVVLLDPARLQARLAEADGALAQALARLDELRRGPRPEAIDRARARLAGSEARLENAELALGRARDLHTRDLGSEAERDQRLAARDDARAQVLADREALTELLNGTTVEELQQAEAAVVTARARREQARLDERRSRLVAPMPAMVDRVLFEQGEQPPRGATVAVLLDQRRAYARIYVPAALRADVQPGAMLTVRLEGVAQPLTGTVRWVSADATFTPYFALTEYDRSRLSYVAEVDLDPAMDWPVGLPVQARLADAP